MSSKLIFIDSFDHYSSGQVLRKWTNIPVGSVNIVSDGRTGNGADFSGGGPAITLFGIEYLELGAGTAYKIRPTGTFSNFPILFQNLAIPGQPQVGLGVLGDGRLAVGVKCYESFAWTPAGGNTVITGWIYGPFSTTAIHTAEWYYLELQAIMALAGSTLSFSGSAYLNGSFLCNVSQSGTVTPANYGTHGFSAATFQGPGAGVAATFDDLYITDGELLGDVKIAVLYPNAAGDSSAWTPNGSGANYTKVDEHIPDDDATYVNAPGSGLVDLYNLDDITSFTGNIVGAQSCVLAKKSDAGSASLSSQIKSSGTVVFGTTWYPSNGSYLYGLDAYRTSPFTLSNWTTPEINALQLGQKRLA